MIKRGKGNINENGTKVVENGYLKSNNFTNEGGYNMEEHVIVLESKRLKMYCLSLDDMLLLREGNQEEVFQKKMGYVIRKVEGLEKELIDEFSHLALEKKESRLWFRLWDIVSKEDQKRIGGAIFKGGPNERGEVEIGYGMDDTYQNQGFCTEAIGEIVKWAIQQEGVKAVTAEAEKENIASNKVLQRIGMVCHFETDKENFWRYSSGS